MKWISIEDKYPSHKQHVLMKVYDQKNDSEVSVKGIFNDYPDYRSWTIEKDELKGRNLCALPTHWMPLPELPEVKNELD